MSEGIVEKSSESTVTRDIPTSYHLSDSIEDTNELSELNQPEDTAAPREPTSSSSSSSSTAVGAAAVAPSPSSSQFPPAPLPRVGALLVETYGRVLPSKLPTTNTATVTNTATTTTTGSNNNNNNNNLPPCAPSKVLFEYARFLVSAAP